MSGVLASLICHLSHSPRPGRAQLTLAKANPAGAATGIPTAAGDFPPHHEVLTPNLKPSVDHRGSRRAGAVVQAAEGTVALLKARAAFCIDLPFCLRGHSFRRIKTTFSTRDRA